MDEWQGFNAWFLGYEGRDSDLVYLQNATNETVRRITRFAQRLSENTTILEVEKGLFTFGSTFANCAKVEDAHRLSACVFGLFHTRIFGPKKRNRGYL